VNIGRPTGDSLSSPMDKFQWVEASGDAMRRAGGHL